MSEITQEEIRKFWEWCGWKYKSCYDATTACGLDWGWQPPNITEGNYQTEMPPITLDNLFRYAVSKLQDKGYQIDITCFECDGFNVGVLNVCHITDIVSELQDKDPAVALFRAIQEVMRNE